MQKGDSNAAQQKIWSADMHLINYEKHFKKSLEIEHFIFLKSNSISASGLVVAGTLVFLLNGYFIELNQAKSKFLNQFLN